MSAAVIRPPAPVRSRTASHVGSRTNESTSSTNRFGYGQTHLLNLGCVLLVLPGLLSIYVAIVFFGLSLGGVTTLYVPIVLQIYHPDKSTAIVGIFSIGLSITAVAAPPIATTLVSSTGSFFPVIVVTMGTVVLASVLIWLGAVTD